jgi:hypothetical protein
MAFKEFNADIEKLIQASLAEDSHIENTIIIYRFVYENMYPVVDQLLEEEVPACSELADLLLTNIEGLIKKYMYLLEKNDTTRLQIHTSIYWMKMAQKTLKKIQLRLGLKKGQTDGYEEDGDGPGPYDDIGGRGNGTIFICSNCYDGYDGYDN